MGTNTETITDTTARISSTTLATTFDTGSGLAFKIARLFDAKIEEIYALAEANLRAGAESFPVHIFPFRMTADAMERHKNSQWFGEWLNFKTGYDYFDAHRRPPTVAVRGGRYVFRD